MAGIKCGRRDVPWRFETTIEHPHTPPTRCHGHHAQSILLMKETRRNRDKWCAARGDSARRAEQCQASSLRDPQHVRISALNVALTFSRLRYPNTRSRPFEGRVVASPIHLGRVDGTHLSSRSLTKPSLLLRRECLQIEQLNAPRRGSRFTR